jgi:RimJ/RimL family protein N-acetyltransferase
MTSTEAFKNIAISRQFPARCVTIRHPEGNLVLRPVLMTDAAEVHRCVMASLPELRRFMPWAHAPRELEPELERLRTNEADYFAGTEMTMGLFRGDEMLTMVGLHPRVPLNPAGLEIGYWAPTPRAGQGWTTLGVQVLACYAFDHLGCTRLQVMCDEANTGSRRVIEKSGFEFEGVLRNMTAPPALELLEKGYCATGRTMMFALFPDTFPRLPWVDALRARLTYTNLMGTQVAPVR